MKGLSAVLHSLGISYTKFLGRWTRWVIAKPWVVVIAALGLTIGSLQYLSQNIAIDTSTGDMLSDKLDFRKFNSEMDAAFPQFSDNLLVVIDGESVDLADQAALKLAEAMRTKPKVFGSIYDLAGEEFFKTNGLLYLDIDELYELSDKLAKAQPFLASLWRDPSLRGLFDLLSKAIDASDSSKASASIEITPLLERIRTIAEAQTHSKFSELSWREMMQGADTGANAKRRFLLIQPALDFGSLQPASDAMDGIRILVQKFKLTKDNGLLVRLSGSAALEQEELESVEQGMGTAGILSFVLVIGLLMVGLRRGWLVISCLITLVMGLIWTGTFAILALGSLNLISVAFAVLFIGLSVDFGIHYALRYQEGIYRGQNAKEALTSAAHSVGGALTLSAIGAAIAFYSFLPTDYNGLAELGLIAGTGMFIAFLANITLLPALLVLRPLQPTQGKRIKAQSLILQRIIATNAKPITWSFILAAAVALFAVPNVVFDFDPLNLKNRQTESMGTLIDLMSDRRTSPYKIDILGKNLKESQRLAKLLTALDEVYSAETIADYVPQNQDEKLDVIMSMALFLSPAFSTAPIAAPSLKDQQASVNRFIEKLKSSSTPSHQKSAHGLASTLIKVSATETGILEFEQRLLIHLPTQLSTLKTSLEASVVTQEELPKSLLERKIAKDGRVKIEVFPKHDLSDRVRLTQFVNAVRTLAPKAIGAPVVILEAGQAILGAFYQAGTLSIALIMIMLFLIFGRVRDVLLVFAPLVLAGIFTLAASTVFGLAFNFANVIVLPLLFGLGVAGGIHLVSRAVGKETDDIHSSTSRAILFSALTTMGSFGSIALSQHPGTASMGLLLTIAITLTLLCTLIFLPALMAYGKSVR